MINVQPLLAALPGILLALFIGWGSGFPLALLLQRSRKLKALLSPLFWTLLLALSGLVPAFEGQVEGLNWLGLGLLSPPLWLTVLVTVLALWEPGRGKAALQISLAFTWLITFGKATAGQSLSSAANASTLSPQWMTWAALGLIGMGLDQGIRAVFNRFDKVGRDPDQDISRFRGFRVWSAAGFLATVLGLELLGRVGEGPLLSQFFQDVLAGLSSPAARGREFMTLIRPAEWIGTLVGVGVGLVVILLISRWIHISLRSKAATRALQFITGLALYGWLLTIHFPAGLVDHIGPTLFSQILVLFAPLAAFLINLEDPSGEAHLMSGLLLTWVLVVGWMPVLGWSSLGDRIYITAAFLEGEGLPHLLLGQAVLANLTVGLLGLLVIQWRRLTA